MVSWGLWFVITWSLVIGLTAVFLNFQLLRASAESCPPEKENVIDLALSGRLELWKAFWGLYFGLSTIVGFLIAGPAMWLLLRTESVQSPGLTSFIAMPIVMSVPITIYLTCTLAAWRCSKNTVRPAWGYAAKGAIIFFTIVPLVTGVIKIAAQLARFG